MKLVIVRVGTVIVGVVADADSGVVAESVTVTVNSHPVVVPVGTYENESTFPGDAKPGHEVAPATAHEYESVPVPPVAEAVTVIGPFIVCGDDGEVIET